MINKVLETIKKYHLIEDGDRVVVGVSGGPDSLSLLYILHELGFDICVAHVNHGLRENANIDEEFVIDFCKKIDVPCFVKKVDLKNNLNGMTLEEAGRKVRYDFFREVMENNHCNKIATAHNSNDNAETVIMNMIRGSGTSGLKGIEPSREDIIRPLIRCTRKEIEEFCKEKGLTPRHDESNDEALFTRNKVRLELIPYIEENINSNVINNINRMSEIISEEEKFILDQVQIAYDNCVIKEEEGRVLCNLKVFNKLDNVIQKRLIIKFIIKAFGNAKDIEKVHIEDILKLCKNNVGKKYIMPNKHLKIYVDKGKAEYSFVQ